MFQDMQLNESSPIRLKNSFLEGNISSTGNNTGTLTNLMNGEEIISGSLKSQAAAK